MPSVATSTQNVIVKTDVELAIPNIECPFTPVCPFIATKLTPYADYISLSANTISIDASFI